MSATSIAIPTSVRLAAISEQVDAIQPIAVDDPVIAMEISDHVRGAIGDQLRSLRALPRDQFSPEDCRVYSTALEKLEALRIAQHIDAIPRLNRMISEIDDQIEEFSVASRGLTNETTPSELEKYRQKYNQFYHLALPLQARLPGGWINKMLAIQLHLTTLKPSKQALQREQVAKDMAKLQSDVAKNKDRCCPSEINAFKVRWHQIRVLAIASVPSNDTLSALIALGTEVYGLQPKRTDPTFVERAHGFWKGLSPYKKVGIGVAGWALGYPVVVGTAALVMEAFTRYYTTEDPIAKEKALKVGIGVAGWALGYPVVVGTAALGMEAFTRYDTPEDPIAKQKALDEALALARRTQKADQAIARQTEIEQMGVGGTEAAKERARIARFQLPDELNRFNLQTILQNYDGTRSPDRLAEHNDFAELPVHKRNQLRDALQGRGYAHADPGTPIDMARKLMSNLHDFFAKKRAELQLHPDAEKEAALKQLISDTYDKIIDAHQNCVDQVNSQLEVLVVEVIAGDATENAGADAAQAHIKLRASYEVFKHKTALIREIAARVNGGDAHTADLERLIKQRLAPIIGLEGEVFEMGAQYGDMVARRDEKIQQAYDLFMAEYNPIKYLAEQLRPTWGSTRVLRNQMMQYCADQWEFGVDGNGPNAKRLLVKLTADNDADPDMTMPAYDATQSATLMMMEKCGIAAPAA